MSDRKCPACDGTRLKPESRSVTVGDKNIPEVVEMPIKLHDQCTGLFGIISEIQRIHKNVL